MSRDPDRHRPLSIAVGVACVVGGVAGIAGLIALTNCTAMTCEVWMLRLGLAGSAILSAMCQIAALLGGWLIWRAMRRA